MSDQSDNRPTPDQLLSVIKRDTERAGQGQLTIFLGMAAGVGKTYAMLLRAQKLKAAGVDVVVGWVDTHGRSETARLTEGLEIFPRKTVSHQAVTIEALDLDGLLARRPKVVIVDELAHTNAPGSRHAKRFQDVRELLAAGIDVFTAVNVQHLESRFDTVREITGISVRETVPDSVIDEADEILLIDLSPEDLIQRLREGRIYPAERAELAARHFFTPGNLTALRELALRAAAGRVDRELRAYKTLHGIEATWKSAPRLLVAVFGSPYAEILIRWTRQLSETTGGSWLGAYVDTGQNYSDAEKKLLEENTQLVRQLGGEFASIRDADLVEGLLRLARQNHVTQIIVGKSQRGNLRNLLSGGSVVHRLLRRSGDIDVYAVTTEKGRLPRWDQFKRQNAPQIFPWGEVGKVAATVLGFWGTAIFLRPYVGYQAVGVVFLMAVLIGGLFLSRAAVFAMAFLLSAIHNFFFIPPLYAFSIREPHDVLMHAMLFLAAFAIGHLTTKLSRQNRLIKEREDRAVQLYQLAHAISEADGVDKVVAAGVATLARTFSAAAAVITYADGVAQTHPGSQYLPADKELAVAEWSRQNGRPAGRFTDALPSSEVTFFPLQSRRTVLGVVGLRVSDATTLDFERRNFAQALIGQIAAGIDRETLHANRKRVEVLEEADRLYRALFDSVSHELKSPLTTIKGAASILDEPGSPPSVDLVSDLAGHIGTEADRLLTIVENMLDMTRLESDAIRPKLTECDIADILGPAIRRVERERTKKEIRLKVEPNTRSILCDGPLAVQALTNVLHNAVVHTGPRGVITISAHNEGTNRVEISISDDGPGLSDPAAVFEKFYRGRPKQSGGIGLGLSIAKGFIETQGGTIAAHNADGGGARFVIHFSAGTTEATLGKS